MAELTTLEDVERIARLTEWALPIRERHFSETEDCTLQLAGANDPYEES